MIFNSYEFVLLFLPIFTLGFNIIRHIGKKNGNGRMLVDLCIVLGSLCFFSLFGMQNLAILFISICFNVCTAIPMSFMRERSVKVKLFGREILTQNIWLFIGITGNLVLLLFFKLSGFFLPIAISFYTFNQISYIVDLCRGDIESFKGIDYLAYVLYFPKLLQGPLMGYQSFEKELDKTLDKSFDFEIALRGLLLFSIGLFKKVIMADTFGKAVDYGYQNLTGLGSIEAVLVALFYSFQLYFDFSGYCDMASGISMLLGIELPVNFDSPYKAVDIVDFWKRWHITLTGFFTKYVYIPLGGNRKGEARTYANFMIVFLLSGFWHGTGWNFILWGAMHGILYVITRACTKHGTGVKVPKAIKVFATFLYVTAAWVFFRAPDIQTALLLFAQMFTGGIRKLGSGFTSVFRLDEFWFVLKVTPLMKYDFVWDVCLFAFVIAGVIMIFFCKNALGRIKEYKVGIGTTLLTAFLLMWCVLSLGGVSTYIYMNF